MKRHYLELWLLLLSAFVVFVVASAFEPPTVAGHKLKPSGFADFFCCAPPEAAEIEEKFVAEVLEKTTLEGQVKCDSLPKTILFIGDSMLDGLSPRLAAYADANGHTLYAVIWYSSTTERWGQSDKLKHYMERIKPDFVFVCLGANELFVRDIASKRRGFVEKIVNDIDTVPFLWIGPPNWKEDTGINNLIASTVPRGSFFESRGMAFERGKDGAHPTPASAMQWMDSVVRWMPAHSSHPILLDLPPVPKSRAKRVFVHQPNEK